MSELAGRLLTAVFEATELSTDEAQYLPWGQELAFGTSSKPLLLGWLIRSTTEVLAHSVWAVRFPAPLIHAAVAFG